MVMLGGARVGEPGPGKGSRQGGTGYGLAGRAHTSWLGDARQGMARRA